MCANKNEYGILFTHMRIIKRAGNTPALYAFSLMSNGIRYRSQTFARSIPNDVLGLAVLGIVLLSMCTCLEKVFPG